MSLYFDGKVDPIAAAGGRELKFVPRHFHTISLSDVYFDTNSIRAWVWKNQSGRFALGYKTKVKDKRVVSEQIVAFEDSSEAIMFSFILPTLKNDLLDLLS
jgi:hypothetical protein